MNSTHRPYDLIPCRGCGELSPSVYCRRCADRIKCRHGNPICQCNHCDLAEGLGFDIPRERSR
jgi:hypothetical protein